MKKKLLYSILILTLLSFSNIGFSQTLNLGTLDKFAAYTVSGAVSNTGPSSFTGDIGTNAGAISGFGMPTTAGTIHNGNATAAQAQIDLLRVYIHLSDLPLTNTTHLPAFGNGETITPGVYSIGGAGSLAGTVTLDGQGNSDAAFVIKFEGAFTPAAGSKIILSNGTRACNVFWIAEGAISIGTSAIIKGTLIAHPGAISFGSGGDLEGRMLSSDGAITFGPGAETLPTGPITIPITCVNTCNNTILGTAANFALFTSDGAVANTATSGIIGDIGTNGGAISGFASSTVIGSFHDTNAVTAQAKIDVQAAYDHLYATTTTHPSHTPAFGSGETLTAGVYSIGGAGSLAGTITLNGEGNPNALFIFKFAGAFTTAAQSKVVLTNGVRRCNVFWIAEGAISMGTFTFMKGTLIANNGANTMGANGNLEGRMLSTGGAIGFSTGVIYNNTLCFEPTPNPSIALTKEGTFTDLAPMGTTNVGDTISYAFVVTNTGNTTLTNITVTDNNATVTGGPLASLAPGASNSSAFTAVHTITQADINAGMVANLATASGNPPTGPIVTGASSDPTPCTTCAPNPTCPTCTNTPIAQSNSIALTKEGTFTDLAPMGTTNVGDTISYAFVVTNTGNTTLTNITVTDNNATVTGGPLASLAPGASNSSAFTAVHTITQADINAGMVANLATASGNPPTGPIVTGASSDPTPCTTCAPNPTCPTCTNTPIAQSNSIALTKEGTFTDLAPMGTTNVGDTISYAFVVTNTGNTTLTNITVTDNNATVTGGPLASLAPGASNSSAFTAVHTITQADINAGMVANLATASGNPPTGPIVTGASSDPTPCTTCAPNPTCPTCTNTPIAQSNSIALTKEGTFTDLAPMGTTNVGDTISYAFVVTNTGNTTLTNITVTDNNATVTGGPLASLAPGASNSSAFTAVHTITQADINAGMVANLATASGNPPTGPIVTGASSDPTPCTTCAPNPTCPTCTNTPIAQSNSIALTKEGTFTDLAPMGTTNVGDTISYAFVVTNTGNTTLTNITVTDNNATVTGGPLASLAPGASNSSAFTAVHTITQADINAGMVANLATASGNPPTGPIVTGASSDPTPCTTCAPNPTCPTCTNTPIAQSNSIALTKEGTFTDLAPMGTTNVGDTISYAFVVTNTGNTTLTNITVTDNNATVTGGPLASLAPGASNSSAFTAVHTITQADINAGMVANLATASGNPPTGPIVTGASSDPTPCTTCAPNPTCPTCTNTPIAQSNSIALTKEGTFTDLAPMGTTNVGDTISYAFVVTNTGNTTLTNITVTDNNATVTGGPLASLAPGASNSSAFTAVHTITQADINAGMVANLATASGNPPTGPIVTGASSDPTPCTTCAPNPTCPTCTNTPIAQSNSIALTKEGTFTDLAPMGTTNVGDTISYAFVVTNTGNTTLTNITVTDNNATVTGGPLASLAPGASNSSAFTAVHTITQADINAGMVANLATASGNPPTGPIVTGASSDPTPCTTCAPNPTCPTCTNTPIAQSNSIALTKEGTFTDLAPMGTTNVGDTISYAFVVTNTGNTTLTNITVTDNNATVTGGPLASLAPGASNSSAFTAVHTITQADINAGMVANLATASGNPPTGPIVTGASSDPTPCTTCAPNPTCPTCTNTPIAQSNSIALTKEGTFTDLAPMGTTNVGDTISYAFVVTNTGNTTLTNITVTDNNATVTGGPLASLAPGASNSSAFTAVHTITQADINAGMVANLATASGNPPTGPIVTGASSDPTPCTTCAPNPTCPTCTNTPIAQSNSIALTKEGTFTDLAPMGTTNVGDTISYAFVVTNTGNTTLTNITVTDNNATVTGGPLASLAPGASNSSAFTAVHTITQADINAGMVANLATASGNPPTGPIVTGASSDPTPCTTCAPNPTCPTCTNTPIAQSNSIALTKEGTFTDLAPMGTTNVGDTISYAFVVTNTGNTTLTNITVTDNNATVTGGPLASLAPGASNSSAFTAVHTITQADINAGMVANLATASGNPPTGPIVTGASSDPTPCTTCAPNPTCPTCTNTPIAQSNSIALTKEGTFTDLAPMGTTNVGDTISYAFVVTNTGNTTLTNITVTDNNATVTGGPLASLAPGASNSSAFTAVHTITQADINAGMVANLATASGNPPTGPIVTGASSDPTPCTTCAPNPTCPTCTNTPIAQSNSIALTKEGTFTDLAPMGTTNVGDTISYAFVVTNTGNTTLTNITVTDNNATVTGGPLASLAPGASNSSAFTAVHTITQADINAGMVANLATASGNPPTGPIVTGASSDPTPCTTCAPNPTCPTCTNTPIAQSNSIALTKEGTFTDLAPMGTTNVGDTISYAFVVTNTGNTTLTNITVTDNNATVTGGPLASLAPGASNSSAFTAVHTITQADINAGMVANLATASGNPPTGPIVTGASSDPTPCTTCAPNPTCPTCTNTPIAQSNSIALTKEGTFTDLAPMGTTNVGDTISYAFVVTNTGNTTLTNITVTDNNATVTGGPLASLAPGASNSSAFTAVHTITQADINAGMVANLATASGNPPTGPIVTGASSDPTPCTTCAPNPTCPTCTNTPIAQSNSIALTKEGTFTDLAPMGTTNVGDTISYAFVVTNTGNTTLTNITVTDNNATVTGGPLASLAPGASNSSAFTAVHTITQADINAGMVANLATASGNPPTGPIVTGASSDPTPCTTCAPNPTCPTCTNTPIAQSNSIALTKEGTFTDLAPMGTTNVGDTISYAFVVTNTGNTTLTNITVTDNNATVTGGPLASLAPGASNSSAFTAVHTITQADINAGMVANLATASGNPPTGPIVTGASSDPTPCTTCAPNPTCPTCTNTPIAQSNSIALTKEGTFTDLAPMGTTNVGDTISYAFVVTNTGNTTLTNITVTDNNATVTGGPLASLAPGASNSSAFTAVHTITQADINAGMVANLATASGNPPTGPIVTGASSDPTPCTTCAPNPTCPTCTNTPIAQSNSIALTKEGTFTDLAPMGTTNVGDTISYAFVVTNTGNTTLTNITVTDNNATVTGGPLASLAPGASNSSAFTAVHTITQADINAGMVANLATASGNPPTGPIVTGASSDPTPCTTCAPNPTCPTCTNTPIAQSNSIALTKEGTFTDLAPMGTTNVGDTISYAFVVTNTGNTTLTNITVTDNNATVTGGPLASLAPGASNSSAFTAVHTITQADINAGMVANLATASGNPPTGPIVTGASSDPTPCTTCAPNPTCPTCTNTPIAQSNSIALTKEGTFTDLAPMGTTNVGDTISYAFVVTNTGNTTLTNITVTDNNATVTGGPLASLAPGASNSSAFTAVHTITQADINAGMVANLATASGNPPTGPIVTGASSDPTPCTTCAPNPTCPTCTNTPIAQSNSIALTKEGTFTDLAPMGTTNVGDTISYAFVVTNTGNTTLTNITVTDNNATVTGGPLASLAPGASNSSAFTAVHTITQADINAGMVANLATASGNPPTGPIVTGASSDPTPCTTCAPNPTCPTCTNTPIAQSNSIALTKEGTFTDLAPMGTTNVGDTISYAFVVTNTGNTTLTNITVTDNNATVTGGPLASLAPGASNSSAFTAVHTITQADINAGMVANLATASGNPPTGPIVTGASSDPTPCTTCAPNPTCPTCTNTPIAQSNSIALTKEGTFTDLAPMGTTNVGDTISYAFVVTNTGNTTLTNITVTDNNATVTGGPLASLAPGASNSSAFTAVHTITQADINAGMVANLATASGNPPTGPIVTGASSDPTPCTTCAPNPTCPTCTNTPIAQSNSIALTKEGTFTDLAPMGTTNVGDTISYAFVVTNTGNTTLTNITVTDNNATVTGGPLASLAPGASNSSAFTAVHTITQADINAGMVANLATASGNPPTGPIVTGASSDPTPCTTCAPNPTCPTCTNTPITNAVKDDYINIACSVSGFIGNILRNDTFGIASINSNIESQVNLTILTGNNPNILINSSNGDVTIKNGIGIGTYIYTYQICNTINSGVCDQAILTISIVDTTAPVIAPLPAETTIFCPAKPVFTLATATDICGGVILTFVDVINSSLCTGSYSVSRNWTATDGAGNQSFSTQTINIKDTTAPVIASLPATSTISCGTTPVFATATATDACGATFTLTSADVTTNDACAGSYSITRTWTATDACGNTANASQTINIKDTTAPVIASLPATSTISCGTTPVFATATATDACGATFTLTSADVTTNDACAGSYSITRTWTATDACGNTANASQTINIKDTTAPVIASLPATSTISCGTTPVFATATATDACGATFTLTSADVTTNDACAGSYSITRTWTATDACGNTANASQTINIKDTTAPVIASLPATSTISCGTTPVFATATATDACGATFTLTSADVTTNDACAGSYSITRTWTATDACGNTANASQTINIKDTNGPTTTTTFASNINVSCDAIPLKPVLVFLDNCSTISPAVFSEKIISSTESSYSIVREWSVSDSCGNVSKFTQAINVSLLNSPVTIASSACSGDSSTINIFNLLPEGTPKNGIWIDVNNTGKLQGNILSPFGLTLGDKVFEYRVNGETCPLSILLTIAINDDCIVLGCGDIKVHNAFSPNGDGVNEVFVIDNIEDITCYPENTVEIYNRWGVLVFKTKNYNNQTNYFEGISHGRTTVNQSSGLPTGTYFYILNYSSVDGNGKIVIKKLDGYLYLSK